MNTPILRISRLVGALFVALLVAVSIIQFVQAPSLRERPGNKRTLLDNYSRPRGAILVGDQAIAVSKPVTGQLPFLRTYPQGPLYAHVTGYYSYVYGAAGGLEATEDTTPAALPTPSSTGASPTRFPANSLPAPACK